MGKNYLIVILILISAQASLAQLDIELRPPSVAISTGTLSFYGDLGQNENIDPLNRFRIGYSLSIYERFSNSLASSVSVLGGKVSGANSPKKNNFNFESSILNVGLNVFYHFDNDYIISRQSVFGPYIGIGAGWLKFTPFADLKDASGNSYYYWPDGTIRNVDLKETDAYSAVIIKRDYKAETNLVQKKADGISYSQNTYTLPVSAGLNVNIWPSMSVNLGTTYYFSGSDWLDDISKEGKGVRHGNRSRDGFLYSYVELKYNFGFGTTKSNDSKYEKVNFSTLEKSDLDKDGVPDTKDKCPATGKFKVDVNGCPLDNDGDGVPNENDKEPATPKGSQVDINGVKLKQQVIEQNKPIAGKRITPTIKKQPSNTGLPKELEWVDIDNDGKITQKEIDRAIDEFFDGNPSATHSGIMRLIDYFFEQ